MRLLAVIAVLAIVGWLAVTELFATTSSPRTGHPMSVRQAQRVAAAAQQQLQQNEARGQQALERGLQVAGQR